LNGKVNKEIRYKKTISIEMVFVLLALIEAASHAFSACIQRIAGLATENYFKFE